MITTKKPNPSMKDIQRISGGWEVTVVQDGIVIETAQFMDADYDVVKQLQHNSLEEAKFFRDEVYIDCELPLPGTHGDNKRNTSGFVGVFLHTDSSGRPQAWVASKGKQTKRFPVSRFGYDDAWERAVKERCRLIGKPIPSPMPYPPKREGRYKHRA